MPAAHLNRLIAALMVLAALLTGLLAAVSDFTLTEHFVAVLPGLLYGIALATCVLRARPRTGFEKRYSAFLLPILLQALVFLAWVGVELAVAFDFWGESPLRESVQNEVLTFALLFCLCGPALVIVLLRYARGAVPLAVTEALGSFWMIFLAFSVLGVI